MLCYFLEPNFLVLQAKLMKNVLTACLLTTPIGGIQGNWVIEHIHCLVEKYNCNCNLSPITLTLPSITAQSGQHELILTLKMLLLRSTFTTGLAHYGQLIVMFNC